MTAHEVWVDEGHGTPAELASGLTDYHARALCRTCEWAEPAWHHASDHGGWDLIAAFAAYDAALEAGQEHVRDTL